MRSKISLKNIDIGIEVAILSGQGDEIYMVQYSVTAESNGLSRGKDHWMYSLGNSNTYCTKKKERGNYLENKYCSC